MTINIFCIVCPAGSELSHTLTAIVIAGSASVTVIALLIVIIIVCLVVKIVKRKSKSVKMVDLGRHNEGDEDEKRPLLPPMQETYRKGDLYISTTV